MYNLGFNAAYARNISVGKASAKATNTYVEKKDHERRSKTGTPCKTIEVSAMLENM